jgi:hypothetical protein
METFDEVECPICQTKVPQSLINKHIDSNCTVRAERSVILDPSMLIPARRHPRILHQKTRRALAPSKLPSHLQKDQRCISDSVHSRPTVKETKEKCCRRSYAPRRTNASKVPRQSNRSRRSRRSKWRPPPINPLRPRPLHDPLGRSWRILFPRLY